MNYLQLSQRLRQEAAISGTGPTSVLNQVGEMKEVVDWANSAYEDIQNLHTNWRFMQTEFSFPLISGTDTYTPAAAGLTTLGEWLTDDTRVYLTQSDENPMQYEPWKLFREVRDIGAVQSGRPTHFSIKPNNSIVFWPNPDAVYTCTGEYMLKPATMTADTDEPIFPSQFHMLVVWRALLFQAALLEAPARYAHGQAEYKRLIKAMEFSQVSKFTYGRPLA